MLWLRDEAPDKGTPAVLHYDSELLGCKPWHPYRKCSAIPELFKRPACFHIKSEILAYIHFAFFPQQCKLMGSSAQKSSGVHWCRRRVRFNEVPEKVLEKVWEALVQSQVRFNRVPEKVPEKVPAKVWEALFPAPGFAARFRKICKNKTLRLLGIPPKLIFSCNFCSLC